MFAVPIWPSYAGAKQEAEVPVKPAAEIDAMPGAERAAYLDSLTDAELDALQAMLLEPEPSGGVTLRCGLSHEITSARFRVRRKP